MSGARDQWFQLPPWRRSRERAIPPSRVPAGTRRLPALRAAHAGRHRQAAAHRCSPMSPPANTASLVRLPAAWRERAIRGSRRFASACRFFGDAPRFAFVPLLRRLPSAPRCLLRRPNRLRFTCQTRGNICSAPSTRKAQSTSSVVAPARRRQSCHEPAGRSFDDLGFVSGSPRACST